MEVEGRLPEIRREREKRARVNHKNVILNGTVLRERVEIFFRPRPVATWPSRAARRTR